MKFEIEIQNPIYKESPRPYVLSDGGLGLIEDTKFKGEIPYELKYEGKFELSLSGGLGELYIQGDGISVTVDKSKIRNRLPK